MAGVQVISIGVLLAVGYLVMRGLMGGAPNDFDVDFDGTTVRTKGRIPAWIVPDLTRLLKDEIKLNTAHIRGRSRGRMLRVDVTGPVPPGDAQRIRNFLKTELKG